MQKCGTFLPKGNLLSLRIKNIFIKDKIILFASFGTKFKQNFILLHGCLFPLTQKLFHSVVKKENKETKKNLFM